MDDNSEGSYLLSLRVMHSDIIYIYEGMKGLGIWEKAEFEENELWRKSDLKTG